MTTRISCLGMRTIGLLLVGIVLLAIGSFASFYKVTHAVGRAPVAVVYQISYPYQIVGLISLVVGIIFISPGFLFQHKKLQLGETALRPR